MAWSWHHHLRINQLDQKLDGWDGRKDRNQKHEMWNVLFLIYASGKEDLLSKIKAWLKNRAQVLRNKNIFPDNLDDI